LFLKLFPIMQICYCCQYHSSSSSTLEEIKNFFRNLQASNCIIASRKIDQQTLQVCYCYYCNSAQFTILLTAILLLLLLTELLLLNNRIYKLNLQSYCYYCNSAEPMKILQVCYCYSYSIANLQVPFLLCVASRTPVDCRTPADRR
jgi:hypothetical protein